MEAEPQEKFEKLGFMNILIIFLSIYVLIALMVDTFIKLPPEISKNPAFTRSYDLRDIFYLIFPIGFYKAESKLSYMKWGWIDLLASIPAVDVLRTGRAFRLIRLLRILRAFKSVHHLVNHIYQKKIQQCPWNCCHSGYFYDYLLLHCNSTGRTRPGE
jgi:voltage-gated potassium channel